MKLTAHSNMCAVVLEFYRLLQLCVFSRPDCQFLMQEHDIGQDFALYYMAFATYLELRGSFAKAEAVFEAGLERCGMQSEQAAKPYQVFQLVSKLSAQPLMLLLQDGPPGGQAEGQAPGVSAQDGGLLLLWSMLHLFCGATVCSSLCATLRRRAATELAESSARGLHLYNAGPPCAAQGTGVP